MEKVYVSIDRNHMKQKYFEKIIGKIISRVTGCEAALAGPLATQLGITYDTQKEHLALGKPTFIRAYMESLIDTVDGSTERWMIEHNEMFRIDEDKQHLAQEAAEQDLFVEDGGDGLGETLSDMVNEMLDKKVGEIKDIAKLVLRLEKEKQDGDKEAALDENEEIEEEDADDTTGAFGEEENGDNSEGDGNGEEGGNPFGEDGADDGSTTDGGEGSEDSGNPFGEDPAGSAGDDDNSGSGNPFDDGGSEGSEDEGSEDSGDNPFAGGSGSEEGNSGDEGSSEGSGNPFESIQEVSKITIGGRTPFYSLRNGDLSGFITGYTRKIFETPMRETFDKFGQESVQFKDLASKMKTTNKAGLEALISVVAVGQALNFKIDMDKIRDWDLYLADI